MTVHDYEKSIKKFGLVLTAAYTAILIATKLVHVGESTSEWNTAYNLSVKHEVEIAQHRKYMDSLSSANNELHKQTAFRNDTIWNKVFKSHR